MSCAIIWFKKYHNYQYLFTFILNHCGIKHEIACSVPLCPYMYHCM